VKILAKNEHLKPVSENYLVPTSLLVSSQGKVFPVWRL